MEVDDALTPVLRPVLPAPFLGVILQDVQRSGTDTYRLALGTPKMLRMETIPAHSMINVTWNWKEENNVKTFGHSELWHATHYRRQYVVEPNWPRRSLVVIQADQVTFQPAACHSVAGSRQR